MILDAQNEYFESSGLNKVSLHKNKIEPVPLLSEESVDIIYNYKSLPIN